MDSRLKPSVAVLIGLLSLALLTVAYTISYLWLGTKRVERGGEQVIRTYPSQTFAEIFDPAAGFECWIAGCDVITKPD